MKTERRERRVYEESFKLQMVQLIESGMRRKDVLEKYELTPSALDKLIKQYSNSKSFKVADNLSDTEKELIVLKKKNKQLEMEVDILKQAALIIGRK